MGNLEDEIKHNSNSAAEGNQPPPAPTVQPKDDSHEPRDGAQPAEIVHRSERFAEAPLVPNQSMPAAGPMQFGPSVKDIIGMIFRFKWTALGVSILVAAPLIAAIWLTFVPKYRARAEVRVRPTIPYLVFQTEESGRIPSYIYDSFVNTQIPIIGSVPVLQRVLDEPQVQQTRWYTNPPESLLQRLGMDLTPPIERLKEAMSATHRKETEIIDVTFADASPGEARLILTKILEHYIKHLAEMSAVSEQSFNDQLARERTRLEGGIQSRQNIIDKLRASLGTATPQELISQKRVRLDETQARLAEVRQNIDLLKWELDKFSADDGNDVNLPVADSMEDKPAYHEDEEWRRLDADVRRMRHEIEAGLRKDTHPDRVRAEKDLEFLEEALRQREAQLDEQWGDGKVPIMIAGDKQLGRAEAVRYLNHQLERAQREHELLLTDVETQQAEFDRLFASAQDLERQSTALSRERETFDAVRRRHEQKNMERNAPGSIDVLMQAAVPSQPYNDRRIVFTVMVTVLALGAGGGAAFLRASRSGAVYDPEDMPYPMQVPFLGYMLVTGTPRSMGRSLVSRYKQAKRDQSSVNESMRIVRTALLSRLDGEDSTAILITSAAEGTGKSHFTLMLGESLAKVGKKVLVIDADLRKMTLTERLKLSGEPGFIQSLHTGYIHKRPIMESKVSGLSFMPAGKRGRTGVVHEEIANGAFKTCLDTLREQYDVILLDGPPILVAADAIILSGQVDGTIMVEREMVSHRSNEIDALGRLSSSGGRLIGTVFAGSSRHDKYVYARL